MVFFSEPWALAALPLAGIPWIVGRRHASMRRRLGKIFESVAVVLLIVGISGPKLERPVARESVVFAVDVSSSISALDQAEALKAILKYVEENQAGEWGLVVFADRGTTLVEPKEKRQFLDAIREGRLRERLVDERGELSGTNLEEGIRRASSLLGNLSAGRIVVLTDGQPTSGDALDAAREVREGGGHLDVYSLGRNPASDVGITGIVGPREVVPGEVFVLAVRLESTNCQQVFLEVTKDGVPLIRRMVDVCPDRPAIVEHREGGLRPGRHVYRASIASPQDARKQNDVAVFEVHSGNAASILYVTGSKRKRDPLAEYLRAPGRQWRVSQVRNGSPLPGRLGDFGAIIVADVSARMLGKEEMSRLIAAVRDCGTGLVFAAAEEGFAPGGYQDTALEEVLPVSLEPDAVNEDRTAVVIAVDSSGSMGRPEAGLSPVELAEPSALRLARLLGPSSRIGIVMFASEAVVVRQIAPVRVSDEIEALVSRVRPHGGTNIVEAMKVGADLLGKEETRSRLLLVISDGRFDSEKLQEVAETVASRGVRISTVYVGQGTGRQAMERLAEAGEGSCYAIEDAGGLPDALKRESQRIWEEMVVAKPVTPRVVAGTGGVLSFLSGEEAPSFGGYVRVGHKTAAEVLMETDSGDPLLARGRYGLGKTAALMTSPRDGRFESWWETGIGGELWEALIGDTLRGWFSNEGKIGVTLDRGVATVSWYCADGCSEDALTFQIALPDGRSERIAGVDVDRRWKRGRLRIRDTGVYSVAALREAHGEVQILGQLSFEVSIPPEYGAIGPDPVMLQRLARAGGGRLLGADITSWPKPQFKAGFLDTGSLFLFLSAVALVLSVGVERVGRVFPAARAGPGYRTHRSLSKTRDMGSSASSPGDP